MILKKKKESYNNLSEDAKLMYCVFQKVTLWRVNNNNNNEKEEKEKYINKWYKSNIKLLMRCFDG